MSSDRLVRDPDAVAKLSVTAAERTGVPGATSKGAKRGARFHYRPEATASVGGLTAVWVSESHLPRVCGGFEVSVRSLPCTRHGPVLCPRPPESDPQRAPGEPAAPPDPSPPKSTDESSASPGSPLSACSILTSRVWSLQETQGGSAHNARTLAPSGPGWVIGTLNLTDITTRHRAKRSLLAKIHDQGWE